MSGYVLPVRRAATPAARQAEKGPSNRVQESLPDKEQPGDDRLRPQWSLARMNIDGESAMPSGNIARRPFRLPALAPGSPLHDPTRHLFERRFGADFGAVRIHTDAEAAQFAHSVKATAIASGPHIWFGRGVFRPDTPRGDSLIAHELVHVLQHRNASHATASRLFSTPADPAERQADAVVDWMANGKSLARWSPVAASSIINLAPETWYRGQAEGVPHASDASATSRGVIHDLGEGTYFTDRLDVAKTYAGDRSLGNPAIERVLQGEIDPRSLGKTLDLTADPEFMRIFNYLAKTGPVANERYRNLVEGHLRNKGLNLGNFDVVIGPEGIRGGKQMVVRDPQVVATVRAAMKPVGPAGSGGGGGTTGGATRQGGGLAPKVEAFKTGTGAGAGEVVAEGSPAAEVGGAVKGATRAARTEGAVEGALKAATVEGGPAPIPKVEGATGVTAEVAGVATETEAVGVAARVAGIALETAAGLVIGIAIGLFLDWLKGKIEEALLKRDLQALSPQIQTKLQALVPKITQLQQQGSKVYSRVTVDVTRKSGTWIGGEGGFSAVATWDNYEGVGLLGVDVSGDAAPSIRSEREEGLSPNESRIHSVETFSTLIDDPQKRARAQQNAALVEHLKKVAPKSPLQESKGTATQAPPLVPSPGIQQTTPTFTPFPNAPGPSPIAEAGNVVKNFKVKCQELLARGERLISTSNSEKTDIDAFKHDEDLWRTAATLAKNYYTDHGPDTGASGMDELLNSDHYGGRLKQIRNTLGG